MLTNNNPIGKYEKLNIGCKALSISPPETMTPLKMVTGLAPKFTTQALQMGPVWKDECIILLDNEKLQIEFKSTAA